MTQVASRVRIFPYLTTDVNKVSWWSMLDELLWLCRSMKMRNMEPVNSDKGLPNGSKLLRKPRAPRVRASAGSPPPKSYLSDREVLNASNPQYAFFPSSLEQDLETLAPSPLSPPPPTESHSRPQSEIYPRSGQSTRKTQRLQRRPEDAKYMLDMMYRERTSLGTYVEGQTLVRPFRTRGPAPLPFRQPKQNPPVFMAPLDEEDFRYLQPPAFTLEDFSLTLSEKENLPLEKVQTVMYSRHTYKRIQQLLLEKCIPKCPQMSKVELQLPEDVLHSSPRIPHHQLLLEMTAIVKEQMSKAIDVELKSVIRPLPQYSPDYKQDGSQPHTQIYLYEDQSREQRQQLSALRQEAELPGRDSIFVGGPPRYFQGSRRSHSPFAAAEEGVISPSELAVLDSIMAAGVALSLKAHFISQMPDIEPLMQTLTYLNLSFNDFRIIPLELFEIPHLTVLKLRNNPIHDVPPEIAQLKNLRVLVMSFCLITTLPSSLYTLPKLEHLDVAYNKIHSLPSDIRRLKQLRELNVEGNELPALPAGALRLHHLKHVRLTNNFMHPLFWKDHTVNEPQRLMDMCGVVVKQTGQDKENPGLPDHISVFLQHHGKCDVCRGVLFGEGLRTIRPVSKIFGIRNVPFLFHCCSNYCLNMFNNNSESLMDMLYGHSPRK